MLLALPVIAMAGGGRQRLSLVWERDLGQFINEVSGANSHTHSVFDLKISDDDRWIGVDVVADRTSMFTDRNHHLMVVPLEWTGSGPEQFEFRHIGGSEDEFFLSADGNLVIMEDGRGIRLEDRRQHTSCSVSPADSRQSISPGGFINAELFLVTRSYRDPHGTARYELYGQKCNLVDGWELSGGAPAKTWPGGHVLVGRYLGGTAWEMLLIEWPTWRTVKRWSSGSGGLAADQGRVACWMHYSDRFECRNIANGAPLANPAVVHYGSPMAVSQSGTLAVATDWFTLWKPFTEGDYWAHVKRQILWDFRSGEVIASWDPKIQRADPSSLRSMGPEIRPFPFICTLSATGGFLLEGGNETLRVSRVNGTTKSRP